MPIIYLLLLTPVKKNYPQSLTGYFPPEAGDKDTKFAENNIYKEVIWAGQPTVQGHPRMVQGHPQMVQGDKSGA
ncbi:MAG: hypothetical protein QME51_04855 [Planctomycetota bacterium]|nr:hypothetical protein [Planctomycetota bacterium]